MSLAATVCVLNFHFRGHKKTRVPKWIKFLLLIKSNSDNINKNLKTKPFENGFVQDSPIAKNNKVNLIVSNEENGKLVEIKKISPSESLNNMPKLNNKEESIRKMCKIIRNCSKMIEKERAHLKHDEKIFIEWKEVARRLDRILFVISVAIVEITPLYLFGRKFKYNFKNVLHKIQFFSIFRIFFCIRFN
jgi:hypothetical protein